MTVYPKVLVLCTVEAGLNSIEKFLDLGGRIEYVLGIKPDPEIVASISGYVDVRKFCDKKGIKAFYAEKYNLNSQVDRDFIETLDYDLIWVTGWQRLIPSWLIDSCTYGAIGGHGSPDGITGGRGRSPQNWAIMLGCDSFDLSLFRISSGVDNGDVITSREFKYSKFDTISSSYQKASLCMSEMVADLFARPELILNAKPQIGEPFYYPQRKPEDGVIDWDLGQHTIFDHCRALTRPYPGLITYHKSFRVVIWKCIPFDEKNGEVGIINHVFNNGEFLVGCGDGRVLVQEYETDYAWSPKVGDELVGQVFGKTLQAIVNRHYAKHPNKKISPRILKILNE